MIDTPGSGSWQSTSDSDMISEDSYSTDLFPHCRNLHFIKKLSDAKFPVFLVSYPGTNQCYAMKVFPWEDDAPSSFFLKEIRFAKFQHPNIISMVYSQFEEESSSSSLSTKVSYILMEYAKYGDFFDVLITYKIPFCETLVRTYFHQLINALEVLHINGAAHLDVKLENLLMSENFSLKLTDFDLSYMSEEGQVKTRGTKNFRAPEMFKGTCTDPQAADIYSAGIILFLLKTGGLVPFREDAFEEEEDTENFTQADSKRFWLNQCENLEVESSFFSEDFKTLFNWMTRTRPEERYTISQIKKSKWYNKEVYSDEQVFAYLSARMGCI